MGTFLAFCSLGLLMLFLLGRAVTPRSKKKRLWAMKLDDFGDTLIRGAGLFVAAGARNRWKIENIQKQADYSERGHNDGDRPATDETEQPPEQIPPGAFPPGQFPTDRFPTGHFPTNFTPPPSRMDPPSSTEGPDGKTPDDGSSPGPR